MPAGSRTRKLFSLVIPTYGVERYIDEFLESVAAQDAGLDDVELIFVIDGSPDASEERVRAWMERTGIDAHVLVKENGGLVSARNAGLALATGEWVTFSDPDDVLHQEYFSRVRGFLDEYGGQDPAYISAHAVRFSDDVADSRNDHTLAFKFDRGQRIVDLDRQPRYLHLQVASGFARLDLIRQHDLTFDDRVRPVFEDARFMMDYLLRAPSRRVGIVPDALYHYRQRADGTSLVQTALSKPENYTEVPRFGYLPPLQYAHERFGQVPRWTQYMVLYDIHWFFKWDRQSQTPTAGISSEVRDVFLDLITQALSFMEDDSFFEYNVSNVIAEIRIAWYVMKNGRVPEHLDTHLSTIDRRARLRQLRYYTVSAEPLERLELDGLDAEPTYAKSRAVQYFGRTIMIERILWVSIESTIRFFPFGRTVPDRLRMTELGNAVFEALPRDAWGSAPPADLKYALPGGPAPSSNRSLADRIARSLKRRWVRFQTTGARAAKSPFRDAWVLIDRDTMAGDNAEALYRYLADHQPQVNAWFVLDKTSPDYRRLKKQGFRLIAHRSLRHVIAVKLARHLISSQVDRYIMNPYDQKLYGGSGRYFTFLQHGVTKDDLSHWLNWKRLDRVITATPAETNSFAADLTPYVVGRKEVRMTGFPRHDELLRQRRESQAKGERPVILFTPTWRYFLQTQDSATTNRRELREEFWASDYARNWFGLANDARLLTAAQEAGVDVVFAPHPNLDGLIPRDRLNPAVTLFSYQNADIKSVLARATVVVSDYSSLAFEGAYAGADVVHFQFDKDTFFSGSHAYRRGYFDYDTDGFGPVAQTVDEAVSGIVNALTNVGVDDYRRRAAETFPLRDGKCAERTFLSIQELDRPASEPEIEPVWFGADSGAFPPLPSQGREAAKS